MEKKNDCQSCGSAEAPTKFNRCPVCSSYREPILVKCGMTNDERHLAAAKLRVIAKEYTPEASDARDFLFELSKRLDF